MTNEPTIPDREYYEEVIDHICSESDWNLEDDRIRSEEKITEVIERDHAQSEIRFSLPDVTGTLTLRVPGWETGSVGEFVLDTPLAPELSQGSSSFAQNLAKAHESIGDRHASSYSQRAQHCSVLLTGKVPPEYDASQLTATLGGFAAAAREAQRLHRLIRFPTQVFKT